MQAKIHGILEIARVLVRLDHVAGRIVNADHSIMWTAAVRRVADCVTVYVYPCITPKPAGHSATSARLVSAVPEQVSENADRREVNQSLDRAATRRE